MLKLNFNSILEEIIFSVGIGFGIFSYSILFLGFIGLLYSALFYLILFLLIIFLRDEITSNILKIYQKIKQPKKETFSLFELLIVLILCFFVFFNFLVSLAPSIYWDELHYHLVIPKIYIQNHKIVHIPFILQSNYPLNLEMLYLFAMLTKDDIFPTLIHCLFGFLSLITIYSISSSYFTRKVSLLSSGIFYTCPIMGFLSNISYTDLGLAFYVILSFYALLKWSNDLDEKLFYVLCIFSGFALSIKYSGLISFLILSLLIFIKSFSLKKIFKFSIICMIMMSPYFIKNFIFTGNPFYPFLFNIFGGVDLTKEQASSIIASISHFTGMGKDIKTFFSFPWNITIYGKNFCGSIGPIFLCLLPFLILLKKLDKIIILSLGFSILYLTLWFFISQQLRFLVPALGILSIICAWTVEKLKTKDKFYLYLFSPLLIFTFLFNFFLLTRVHANKISVALGLENKEDYLSSHLETYDAFKFINENLPYNAKIFLANDNRGYYCDRDFIYYNGEMFCAKDDVKKRYNNLKKRKVSHLLFNFLLSSFDPELSKVILNDLEKKYLKTIFYKNDVALFKINYWR